MFKDLIIIQFGGYVIFISMRYWWYQI